MSSAFPYVKKTVSLTKNWVDVKGSALVVDIVDEKLCGRERLIDRAGREILEGDLPGRPDSCGRDGARKG
jgi:hypothetical protein